MNCKELLGGSYLCRDLFITPKKHYTLTVARSCQTLPQNCIQAGGFYGAKVLVVFKAFILVCFACLAAVLLFTKNNNLMLSLHILCLSSLLQALSKT